MSRSVVTALLLIVMSGLPALACPQDDIKKNASWCFADLNRDGYGDLVVGSCKKDANKTHDGFFSCQHDSGIRGRYDGCGAGEQLDAVRAAGMEKHVYSHPHEDCGL